MLCFLRFFTRFIPSLRVMFAEFCSLWQQNDTIQKFCLPHSSTFFCLVCVTLPSFSSFSLYAVPSFCRFLSNSSYLSALNSYPQTGLRIQISSPHSSLLASAVTAVVLRVLPLFFLCLALFVLLSVLLAVICARPLPFFLLLSAKLFNKRRKPAICSTAPRTART